MDCEHCKEAVEGHPDTSGIREAEYVREGKALCSECTELWDVTEYERRVFPQEGPSLKPMRLPTWGELDEKDQV